MLRKTFLIVALLLLPILVGTAWAAPYDAKAFAEAQAAGKPVLVHIHADWCTVCAAQKPVVSALMKTPEFADLVLFMVDFDRQKDVGRQFGARMQSTLIVFQGASEKGRSVGDADADRIKALIAKGKPAS